MSLRWLLVGLAVLGLCGCPAEEDNNGTDAGMNNDPVNSNPAECPNTPPATAEACEMPGLACTYSLECPCGPRENFVWTCTDGTLQQPSLLCSTGIASDCPNMNTPDMSLPGDMSSGDMSGMDQGGQDMAPDMPPDMPPARLEAHGCTYATAMDMTGNATVVLTDILAWDLNHNDFCLLVDAGTVVTWNGNFTNHPLAGGVSPTANPNSPITIAAADASGDDTVDVTFTANGDYPYYCTIHTGVMRGVIYVD